MNQNDALIALCRALLEDPKMTGQPGWAKLIIIGEADEDHSGIHGYSYDEQGTCKLVSPSLGWDFDGRLRDLQEAMRAENPTGRAWLKCMIRISVEGRVGADFEYDNPKRWEHTVDNYKERMAEYAQLPV